MVETANDARSEQTSVHRGPQLGLALSGGGARGLAHIGVLRVLEREGVHVDYVSGTSMGGVIAAAYAAGMSPDELEAEAKAATRLGHLLSLADPGILDGGLLGGRRLLAYFEHHLGRRSIADLPLPLAVVTVDLNTRREVVLSDGPVALAVRATTSVPGLFAPVEVNGQRLVDGGLLNNLPVDVVRQMGAGAVIAVDVASGPETSAICWIGDRRWVPGNLNRTLAVLDDAMGTFTMAATERKLREFPPDLLIRPMAPQGINLLAGYHRVAELVAGGERAAEAALPQMRACLDPRCRWSAEGQTPPVRVGSAVTD